MLLGGGRRERKNETGNQHCGLASQDIISNTLHAVLTKSYVLALVGQHSKLAAASGGACSLHSDALNPIMPEYVF